MSAIVPGGIYGQDDTPPDSKDFRYLAQQAITREITGHLGEQTLALNQDSGLTYSIKGNNIRTVNVYGLLRPFYHDWDATTGTLKILGRPTTTLEDLKVTITATDDDGEIEEDVTISALPPAPSLQYTATDPIVLQADQALALNIPVFHDAVSTEVFGTWFRLDHELGEVNGQQHVMISGTVPTAAEATPGIRTGNFDVNVSNDSGDDQILVPWEYFTLPSVVAGFTATRGDQRITLSWTSLGSDITRYEYTRDGGDTWVNAGTGTSFVVTGLTNGTEYTFQIRAVNPAGEGPASGEVMQTPAALPSQVTGVMAIAGSARVTLSWTAADGNGATILRYEYTIDGGTNWVNAGTGTTFVVTGLTNGVSYTFQVRAVNAVGAGTPSTVVTESAGVAPGRVTGLMTTAGNAEVTLSWTAPTNFGSGTFSRYEYTRDGGTTWVNAGTGTRFTVTGLTNDTEYTFQVRAVTSDLPGPASAAATATPTALMLPAAIQNFRITYLLRFSGQAWISLSYTAPPTGVTVEYRLGNDGTWATHARADEIYPSVPFGTVVSLRGRNSDGPGPIVSQTVTAS